MTDNTTTDDYTTDNHTSDDDYLTENSTSDEDNRSDNRSNSELTDDRIFQPVIPAVESLPSGLRTSFGRSKEAAERKEHQLQMKLAKKFTENAPVIHMPFSLQDLKDSTATYVSLEKECHRLKALEPQVMSAIFVDNTGAPILAYCAHRPLPANTEPVSEPLTYNIDNQYIGRTQADMDALKAAGTNFVFDGLTALCSKTRIHKRQDRTRHLNINYMEFESQLEVSETRTEDPDFEEMRQVEEQVLPEPILSSHHLSQPQTFTRYEQAGVTHLVHGWIQRKQRKKGLYMSRDITLSSQSVAATKKFLTDTRPISIFIDALLANVLPDWHKIYSDAFKAGAMFSEDPGPYYGRAIIYKLQGKLHFDQNDAGPSVSFGSGFYKGGNLILPQLKANLRYGPGQACLLFSGCIAHLVDTFQPGVQTLEMKERNITPGRVGTVYFFPEASLEVLKDKPPGWAARTAFGSNPAC